MSLHKFALAGDLQKLEECLQKRGPSNINDESSLKKSHGAPLHDAAAGGFHACLVALLDNGADPHLQNTTTASTPLHLAAEYGHLDCVTTLLQRGASVDTKDSMGMTALHTACRNSRHEVVKKLVDFRCDVNCTDNQERTPLFFSSQKGDLRTIAFLIDSEAEYMAKPPASSPLKALQIGREKEKGTEGGGGEKEKGRLERLSKDMVGLVNCEDGADLEIIVEETPLFAHKTILKYRCPSFFEKHLSSSPSKVVLEDETFRAFYVFLEFLYTGNVLSFHSNAPQYCKENAGKRERGVGGGEGKVDLLFPVEVASLAQAYEVEDLAEMSIAFICDNITPQNLLQSLKDFNSVGFQPTDTLLAHYGSVFVRYIDEISVQPDFGALSRKSVAKMISLVQLPPLPPPKQEEPKPMEIEKVVKEEKKEKEGGRERGKVVKEEKAVGGGATKVAKEEKPPVVAENGVRETRKQKGRTTGKRKRTTSSTQPVILPAHKNPHPLKGRNLSTCRSLLKILLTHKESEPFREPVDVEGLKIPDYPLIIDKPMDLGTISKRLKNTFYGNYNEFYKDVKLVFDNAMTYNRPDSEIYHTSEKLMNLFQEKFDRTTTWEEDTHTQTQQTSIPDPEQQRPTKKGKMSAKDDRGATPARGGAGGKKRETSSRGGKTQKGRGGGGGGSAAAPVAPVEEEVVWEKKQEKLQQLVGKIEELSEDHLGGLIEFLKQRKGCYVHQEQDDSFKVEFTIDSLDDKALAEVNDYVMEKLGL